MAEPDTLFSVLLIIGFAMASLWVARRPYVGLLMVFAVDPITNLFQFSANITVGRLFGAIAIVGWIASLKRRAGGWHQVLHLKLAKAIWLFPLACFASLLFGEDGVVWSTGLSSIFTISVLGLMALMIEDLVDTKDRLSLLIMVLALSSMVITLFPFAYYFDIDLYAYLGVDAGTTVEGGRALGLTDGSNGLGVSASMGLFATVIYLSVKHRIRILVLFAGVALVLIGGLLLSGSRTNMVASMVFLGVLLLLRFVGPSKGRIGVFLGAGVVAALLFFALSRAPQDLQERFVVTGGEQRRETTDRKDFTRVQMQHAVDILWEHPLFGVGLRNFYFPDRKDAHDTLSMVFGETGMIGGISILWLLFSCFRWLFRGIRTGKSTADYDLYHYSIAFMASFAAMLVACLGGYIIVYQRWFWVCLGISAVLGRWASESHPVSGPLEAFASSPSHPVFAVPRISRGRGATGLQALGPGRKRGMVRGFREGAPR